MVLVWMQRCILEVQLVGGEYNGQLALTPQTTLAPSEGQTGLAFVLK